MQKAVRLCARPLGLAGQRDHLALQDKARRDHENTTRKEHPNHVTANRRHKREEQHDKRQIGQRADGRGGKEFTDRPKLTHGRKRLRRGIRGTRFHAQHLINEELLHFHLNLTPCPVHQTGARDTQEGFQDHREASANGQNPKGRGGLVRDHAVIDLQGKQRDRHGQEVRNERPNSHFSHMAAEAFQFAPEPVGLFVLFRMATGQFTHRNIGTHNRAREHRHEFRQRHLCTVPVASGVIDKERIALLFEHQNHLARGHLGQRGPERVHGRCDLFDLRHQTRIRQRTCDPS